jgi:hypothetical protein
VRNWEEEIRRISVQLRVHTVGTRRAFADIGRQIAVDEKRWNAQVERVKRIADPVARQEEMLEYLYLCPGMAVVIVSSSLIRQCWQDRTARIRSKKQVEFNLFELDTLCQVLDEPHLDMANPTATQSGAHHIGERACFSIMTTATPVIKSPDDVSYILNAAGMPQGPYAANCPPHKFPAPHITAMRAADQKAKTVRRKGNAEEDPRTFYGSDRWYGLYDRTGRFDSRNTHFMKASRIGIGIDKDNLQDFRKATRESLTIYRQIMIRRSKRSLDIDGKPLVELGSVTEWQFHEPLREEEAAYVLDILRLKDYEAGTDRYEKLAYFGPAYKASLIANLEPESTLRALDRQLTNAGTGSVKKGKNKRSKNEPKNAHRSLLSPESIKMLNSTQEYWSSRTMAIVGFVEDREKEEEARIKAEETAGSKRRRGAAREHMADQTPRMAPRTKYIVYTESLDYIRYLKEAFQERGIDVAIFDGKTAVKKRQDFIREVNIPGQHRGIGGRLTSVLLCSAVAGLGINLSCFRVQLIAVCLQVLYLLAALKDRHLCGPMLNAYSV